MPVELSAIEPNVSSRLTLRARSTTPANRSASGYVRYTGYGAAHDSQLYLVEEPPHHQIVYHMGFDDPYNIPLPWTYYIVCDSAFRTDKRYCVIGEILFSPVRLAMVGHPLYYAFLPNLSGARYPCYGRGDTPQKDLGDRIIATYIQWWDSTGHYDLGAQQLANNRPFAQALGMSERASDHGKAMGKALKRWEKLSFAKVAELPYTQVPKVWAGFEDADEYEQQIL